MQALGQVQQGSREGSEGSGEGLGGFGTEPGQVQQGSREGSGEGSGEGLGGFSAERGQVQQDSGEGSGEGLGGFGSGEGLGGFGAEPGQVQQVLEKVPEKVLGGFGARWSFSSVWLRSMWKKYHVAAVGDTTETYFIFFLKVLACQIRGFPLAVFHIDEPDLMSW